MCSSDLRINYHFESKANLAKLISLDFFNDFFDKIQYVLRNEHDMASPKMEVICIDLFLKLLMENENCRRFFREICVARIFVQIWYDIVFRAFKEANKIYKCELSDDVLISYATIYAQALDGLVVHLADDVKLRKPIDFYIDIFERLFMKMMDRPKEMQDHNVKVLESMAAKVGVEVNDFTHLKVWNIETCEMAE